MAGRSKLRRLSKMRERKLKEYLREIQETDLKIAEKNRAADDRLRRLGSLNPNSIIVMFDTMHSTSFVYKNMPFWRTTLGFALGVLVSWSTVELLRMIGFLTDGWPQWSLLAFYLLVTFVMTAMTSLIISYRCDYRICVGCGKRKDSWESTLCRTCLDDYGLQYVKGEVSRLILRFMSERQERDKERKNCPQEFYCQICKSRLHWDTGWDAYICSEHGDIDTQSLHIHMGFIREQVHFLENLANIG